MKKIKFEVVKRAVRCGLLSGLLISLFVLMDVSKIHNLLFLLFYLYFIIRFYSISN